MRDMIALISANYASDCLGQLTEYRPMAAMPFAGRYRLLDFALSNAVNSGIRTVGIISPFHYRPLMDHLGSGSEWFLNRKIGGLFMLPGSGYGLKSPRSKFLLRDFLSNREFLERTFCNYVLITGSNQVWNIDFKSVLKQHEMSGADITLVYKQYEQLPEEHIGDSLLKVTPQGRVTALLSSEGWTNSGSVCLFADAMLIRRELLLEIMNAYNTIEYIDLQDIISENVRTLKISGYRYSDYLGRIETTGGYFRCSMQMLDSDIYNQLFMGQRPVYTKVKDNPPTKYLGKAMVNNSLIASGCIINGLVKDSIVFRGVDISEGAKIKNCIIMQKCSIAAEVELENVILDKYVKIGSAMVMKGSPERPIVQRKNSVL